MAAHCLGKRGQICAKRARPAILICTPEGGLTLKAESAGKIAPREEMTSLSGAFCLFIKLNVRRSIMSEISRAISRIVAPSVYAMGLALRNDKLVDLSGRLDPLFIRAFIHRVVRRGWDADWVLRLRFARVPQFISLMNSNCTNIVNTNFSNLHSQILQDLFVLLATEEKKNGYFVEVGVGDGINLSNTYLFEKNFGWKGILAEPNPSFHAKIAAQRTSILDRRAVYSRSGENLELLVDTSCGELSTLSAFKNDDNYKRKGKAVPVATVTLDDLLAEHGAPDMIDYMSIDTEGSEFEVLSGLDMNKTKVMVFTIETNYNLDKLNKIKNLLHGFGYKMVLEEFSLFDAWFVHRDLCSKFI